MKTLHSVSRVLEYVIFGVWSKMKMQYLTYGQKWKCEQSTTPGHWPHRNIDQIGTPTMRPEGPLVYIYFYILSVRLSVCVVDHALTAVPIDFIFGIHKDVIPGSDIGILFFHFCSLKIIYGQDSYFVTLSTDMLLKGSNPIYQYAPKGIETGLQVTCPEGP